MTESIRPVLQAADRSLALDIKRRATVGALRAFARDAAGNLFGVNIETAEVVTLQDQLEAALGSFCEAMRSPTAAAVYTSPDLVRAKITAQGQAEKLEIENE